MQKAIAITDYHQSIDDIDTKIVSHSHKLNTIQYELLVLIREFDERMGWLRCGSRNCAEWLQWRCDLGAVAAREKVRVANALAELPCISAEFASGSLSYTKVRALTRIANGDNEAELVDVALRLSAANLEAYCRQRKNVSAESAQVANAANDRRSCSSWCNENSGMMTITLEVPIEEGQLVEQALEKAVHSIDLSANAPDDDTSWTAIRADAMINMAREYLAPSSSCTDVPANNSKISSSAADHYQVMIHVDESALTRQEGQSEMSIETVKRLCCDGSVIGVVENSQGEPLSVGRKQRTVSTAIRRALWARDRGCAFPGCSHTRYVDAHHLQHWADGGETSVENCCLLCSHHHKLVHEGGYSVRRAHTGQIEFTRCDGRVIPASGYQRADWQDVGVAETDECMFPRKLRAG